MIKIKKFLKALLLFIRMYREGFYFSDNAHIGKDGSYWGFFRFNHESMPALFDVDFSFRGRDGDGGYFHSHGDDCRAEFDERDGKIKETVRFSTKRDMTSHTHVDHPTEIFIDSGGNPHKKFVE